VMLARYQHYSSIDITETGQLSRASTAHSSVESSTSA
jgi:hypothetical protein